MDLGLVCLKKDELYVDFNCDQPYIAKTMQT
jgi:hypothetical protein